MTHVDDVPRGKECGLHCPSCEAPLKANKGAVRQHHLAHMQGHTGCEGWLHSTAKLLLYQRIADAIADGSPLPIEWSCEWPVRQCNPHKEDLLGKGILNIVSVERHLPNWDIRPDIVCMTGDSPKVLIEVVDSHAPEPAVIATGLPVLEVHVSNAADLPRLTKSTVPVDRMHNYPCPEQPCDICSRPKSEGCTYCDRCGKHCHPCHHSYCPTCDACTEPKHRHRYCPQCDKVIVEELWEQEGTGCGGWTHLHCEGCHRLLRPKTRPCGCLKSYCRPCWRKL
jgi:hypothetical protein